jgi:ribosome-binding factor A
MRAGKRAYRLGEQILKEIALLIIRKVKDPRVQGVTLTGMVLTDDLKQGKVYYSVMGGQEERERAQTGLDSAKGYIKRQIGLRMKLRYVPEMTFIHDSSLESGSHMERLFDRLEAGRQTDGSG